MILLASQSPRRRELLAKLGIPFRWIHPGLDDAELVKPGATPTSTWVAGLAYLKARAGSEHVGAEPLVIGADTVCVNNRCLLGQPRDADEARWMIHAMASRSHDVLTGVALLVREGNLAWERSIFVDRVAVEVGPISGHEIDAYISTDGWRGKAGAYNLSERLAAGWPIRIAGSASTVMGLPIERLTAHVFIQRIVNK